MTVDVGQQVQSCEELLVGDQIEAWHNGKLFHRGKVIRTVADTDLFWILDERTGTRRLIDAEVLVVRRVPVPAAAAGLGASGADVKRAAGLPAQEARKPAAAGPHVPLFHAPTLAP
ncbi:hypothetical protein [Arthrobacter sp. EPSL27]|uniref:hypothetical protein n=1 Tax=Arthrobacter sp. EPSL27 TaxID=1745378 RepID=UPI0009E7C730|nr:hypothetical protein [Arthrobacter sp. EPSL27]